MKPFLKVSARARALATVCAAAVLVVCMPEARSEIFPLTVDFRSNIDASGLASTAGLGPNGPGILPGRSIRRSWGRALPDPHDFPMDRPRSPSAMDSPTFDSDAVADAAALLVAALALIERRSRPVAASVT